MLPKHFPEGLWDLYGQSPLGFRSSSKDGHAAAENVVQGGANKTALILFDSSMKFNHAMTLKFAMWQWGLKDMSLTGKHFYEVKLEANWTVNVRSSSSPKNDVGNCSKSGP